MQNWKPAYGLDELRSASGTPGVAGTGAVLLLLVVVGAVIVVGELVVVGRGL